MTHAAGHEGAVHDKHAGHHTEDFLKKFWLTLALTIPIFFYSEMARELFGLRGPEFTGWPYALLARSSFSIAASYSCRVRIESSERGYRA